jgi:hypothetical protein
VAAALVLQLGAARAADSWPAQVPDFTPPAPGEHPRLLFRKADIPALRKRAQTPMGQAMIARLKVLLGGGEAMPTQYCNDKPVNYLREKTVSKKPVGMYTLSHGVGFGLLYVLTEDKKYADLARQCLDKIFEGQMDRDSRYNWTTPGTGFRLSFVLQSICLTYDLCADAWPADYKRDIVQKVMNCKQKKVNKNRYYTLEKLADAGGYPPGSNHYGAYIMGPGLVALTFKGEPGADDRQLDKLLAKVEKNLDKVLGKGFGDHGWFAEGTSCGRIASNNGVIPLLQSLKVAAGKDYISPRPHGRYTVLRFMHEILPTGEGTDEKAGKIFRVPSRLQIPHRGDYGYDTLYKRPIISHLGDFAQGMGAVNAEEAQAMGWIYDRFVDAEVKKTYNADYYPHLAVYAFVNWPDEQQDPDEVLPHVMADDIHGYYVARKQWHDKNDILVTTLLKRGPNGYKSGKVRRGTVVWGLGEKFPFGSLQGKTTHFRAGADGSMELADENGNALAVDYSGASAAEALIVATGAHGVFQKPMMKVHGMSIDGTPVTVLTLTSGEHAQPKLEGGAITVGGQIIRLVNGKLTLQQFTPEK